MNVIVLKNVWKTYRMGKVKVHALRNINLKIKKGEFIAIVGASGSGKSTLMNQIGCLDTPTKGEVFLKDININRVGDNRKAELRGKYIGFVFQKYNLIPTLTAQENVELPMIFQKVPKKERYKRAKELLEMMGLEKRRHHKPTELSGGQQQRVSIARALANNPELILADEPTGNLDSVSGKKVIDLLKKLNKENKKTIVLVTHDNRLAKIANRIIKLKDGEIVR